MSGYNHRARIDVRLRLAAATPSAVANAVGARAARVYNALGMTSSAELLDVRVVDESEADVASAFPEFFVDDRRCAYDQRIGDVAKRYVGGNLSIPEAEAEYIGLLCQHALTAQPELLVGDAAVQAWLRAFDRPVPDADVLTTLLAAVRARVSIGQPESIDIKADGQLAREATEDYIAAQADVTVVVRVSPAFLNELGQVGPMNVKLDSMRDELFVQFGVPCPLILMEPDAGLRERSLVVVLNALESVPWVVFPPDRAFVNETVDRLKLMDVDGEPFPSPDLTRTWAIVALAHQPMLDSAGVRTLTPSDYLIEIVRAEISRNLAALIHRNAIEFYMDQFNAAFPQVRQEAERFVSVAEITAILRELVRDRMGIRNILLILERMMDYRGKASPEWRDTVLDDPWLPDVVTTDDDDLLAFVRRGLCRQAASSLSRNTTNTVVVYLLDVSILDALATSGAVLSNELQAALLESVDAELAHFPATATRPAILTTAFAARRLRDLFRAAYPDMPVVAFDELPAGVNVQPIARLSLGMAV